MFGFERLDVWKRAIEFAKRVYSVTKHFPADERFGLTNQLRRASVSVSANLAEGSGRGTNPEFIRFIGIAYGSLMEVVSHITIAKELGFVNDEDFKSLHEEAHVLSRMMSGLKKSLSPPKN